MKRIVILLGVLFAAIVGKAQVTERASAILQKSNGVEIFYGADALKDALEAAPNSGASIYLSAGMFNGATVTKLVNIYGTGWVTALSPTNNDNPIENSILPTIISSSLVVDFSENTFEEHNIHIEGLRFNEPFYLVGDINGLEMQKCYFAKNIGGETVDFITSVKQKNNKFIQCYVGAGIFAPYQTTFYNCYIDGNTRFRHAEHDGGWLRFYHCIINNTYNQSPIHDLFECYYSIVFIRNLSNKFFFENCMMDFSDLGLWTTVNWYGMNYSTVFEDANNINYSDERTFTLKSDVAFTCPDGAEVGINGGQYAWNKNPQTNVINNLKITSVGGSGVKVDYGSTTEAFPYAYLWFDGQVDNPAILGRNQSINTSLLSPGVHMVGVRLQRNDGLWSNHVEKTMCWLDPGITQAQKVTSCEYWIDGVRKLTSNSIGSQQIDVSTLQPGLHRLLVRIKDDKGVWSNQMARRFFVAPPASTSATTVTAREFWIDGKIASRLSIDGTPAVIDISGLSAGMHTLTMRVQDDKGVWSSQIARRFFVAPIPAAKAKVVKYMYWIDDDKEHPVVGEVNDDNELVIDVTALADGKHTLTWCVLDSKNAWSNIFTKDFYIGGNVDIDGYYLIGSSEDWKSFAELVKTMPTANVRMTADIDLGDDQTMIGTTLTPYQGIFDGQGHTLTVALTVEENGVAPFRYLNGATIENLHVKGSVHTNYCGVGGIANQGANVTIRRCWSSVSLGAVASGNQRHSIGGIMMGPGANTVIEDCLFDGSFDEKNGHFCGGFVNYSSSSVTIRNSLNIGTYYYDGFGYSSGTFIRPGSHVLENLYFLHPYGTVQGTQVTEAQLTDGSITEALQASRGEEIWQQGSKNPIPKVFFTVSEKGDANNDKTVNATDIVAVMNYIMGNPPAGFNFAAADVNNDGEVNVSDIVAIINIMSARPSR